MKNKQIILKLELREGCLDPSDPKLQMFHAMPEGNVGDLNPETLAGLKSMLTDVGYLTVTEVKVEDCDCDVEPLGIK